MVIFYKKWKKYNEFQLTKNKMDLNIRKMTNHPPSPGRARVFSKLSRMGTAIMKEDKETEESKREAPVWEEVNKTRKKYVPSACRFLIKINITWYFIRYGKYNKIRYTKNVLEQSKNEKSSTLPLQRLNKI